MDFQLYRETLSRSQSKKWSPRTKLLDAYERVLYGEQYAHIRNPYTRENEGNNGSGKRLPLDERRSSIEYRLPGMLVRDVVGETWGEEHRPNVLVHGDPYTSTWIQAFVADTSFFLTMIEATYESSIGSGCVVLRVLADPDSKEPGAFSAEVWPSKECTPIFLRHRPGVLKEIARTYPISADALRADGYDVDAIEEEWRKKKARIFRPSERKTASEEWVLRIKLTSEAEEWFKPVPQWMYESADFTDKDWETDDRTQEHDLGEVPAIWLRPIPFRHKLFPDGLCLFEPAINFQFRIDRTLSQTGRAFDYAGDPQLAVSDGGSGGGDFGEDDDTYSEVGGATASDTIPLSSGGKAEFVEISGEGLRVAIEIYVKTLTRLGKEVAGASMIDPESKLGQNLSGTAMKLMRASLRILVGIIRITVGERGFLDIIRLAMRMSEKVDVELPTLKARLKSSKTASGKLDPRAFMELQWPNAYQPEGQDKLFEVQATKLAALDSPIAGPAIVSQATAVANGAPLFDIQDSAQELDAIESDATDRETAQIAHAQAMATIEKSQPKQPGT